MNPISDKVQKHALLSNFTPSVMAPQVLEDILVQRHELVADLVDRALFSVSRIQLNIFPS